MDYRTEICVGSAAAAFEAQRCGAERVELCSALSEGGVTPSCGEIRAARELLTATRLHIIIRPRGGDFFYSDVERRSMAADIEAARLAGADGVVIGCLTANGDIDMALSRELVSAAEGMSVTFHRAFDMCRNQHEALEQLVELGCDRVLTSGAHRTAEEGVDELRSLVEQAAGRIIVMPGCGINAQNIRNIAVGTGASEFHFSANKLLPSPMLYRNLKVSMGGDGSMDEYALSVVDADKILTIRQVLNTL